jgi:hypothetical protein
MSKPKLCPFLTLATRINFQADVGIAACLRSECQLWIPNGPEYPEGHLNGTALEGHECRGWCGLAGKP